MVVNAVVILAAFALSLAALLVAAKVFTNAAERVGLALGLSAFVVGVLIVAVGTSLPELVAGIVAVQGGVSEIVAGSVLGSNNSNLLLVMGAVAVAARGTFTLGEAFIQVDKHFLLGSVLMLGLVMPDGVVDRVEALFLLVAYAVYVFYLLRSGEGSALAVAAPARPRLAMHDLLLLAGGGVAIAVAAERTVHFLTGISDLLAVSPAVASVTILSIGATLPEAVIGATASRRGQGELAVGLILGSCIFNALGVLGVAALVGPVAVPSAMSIIALPVHAAAALLFYLLTMDAKVSRWEGSLFLLVYALFLVRIAAVA